MNTRKYLLASLATIFVASFVLIAAGTATAQGRYASRYSKRDVSGIISRMENASDTFRRSFDRAMDRSNINGTQEEDRLNNIVQDFENSVDQLRGEFDRNNSWWESRQDVQDVIRDARPVNTMINNLSFRRNIENQWNSLRNNINTLADTYDLPGLNGGGWNGGDGGNWGGGGAGNVPGWAAGTFYGRNPETGGTITLSIQRNGSVTISTDGNAQTYASMNRTTLTNGPYVSRVTRISNGIRTTDVNNGSYIDYYTTPTGGGGGGGNVPSWATGTFYGRNPQSGGTITLAIQRNGSVTISTDGNQATYGSMNSTTLTNGQYVSRVTRINNGIRTTDVNNGSYIDYYASPGGIGDSGGGNVPSWATGTFYGRNPQSGGTIVLTIQRNGSVTISTDGNAPTYGSMNRTTLTNGQYVSRVTRINNGIRTTDVNNGNYIDYFRQ